jgi:hypothetical protein
MTNMRLSLLLRPAGVDVSISCARSGVRQFLSFVFKQCSLYSFYPGVTRSICFVFIRSSCNTHVLCSGMSKFCFIHRLEVCEFLIPSDGLVLGFCQ